jgi:Rrf2 family protein
MALMSRKVDYALLILAYLDQKHQGGSAREIADRYGLNRGFVANILKELCRKGFVVSHRGVKGGYALLRPSEAVNLAELMDALDDSFSLAECMQSPTGDHCSHTAICPVKGAIAEVHRRIRDVLRGVTLAEVFRSQEEGRFTILGLNLVSPEQLLATP